MQKKYLRFSYPLVYNDRPKKSVDAFKMMVCQQKSRDHRPPPKNPIRTILEKLYNDIIEHLSKKSLGWSAVDYSTIGHDFCWTLARAIFYADPFRQHFKDRARDLPLLLTAQVLYNDPSQHRHRTKKDVHDLQGHTDQLLSMFVKKVFQSQFRHWLDLVITNPSMNVMGKFLTLLISRHY